MADRTKLKSIGRSASTESTEYSITMGKSVRRRKAKPKERWLLTRKTWRYMADAGRKLIPDGAQNRPEDIPKIEAYFQEICRKEPKFLLWRKNSYPGAIGFRKKRRNSRKGGSCRKSESADEVSLGKPERPTYLAIEPRAAGKFDLKRMKKEFLSKDGTPVGFSSYDRQMGSIDNLDSDDDENQLVHMLEQYLKLEGKDPDKSKADFNYQDLVDKLQRHLIISSGEHIGPSYSGYSSQHPVRFQGDHVQRSLLDTLSRYYGQTGNRDKIVSDLLTDRKSLEKLYFELRKTKGFRGSRGGTGYAINFPYSPRRSNYENAGSLFRDTSSTHVPPLIEVQAESTDQVTYHNWATQTMPIPESLLTRIEEEYKKAFEEKVEEDVKENRTFRRRSSVDNDDVSQSVSDTIKRYLRMARKKSVDVDKADRFKRVNYDRNLRNIKAKGEITKPGDDDGLNKGCQTNDDWILTYRNLKFADMYDVSDVESRFSSSRSSVDMGLVEDGIKSLPSSPPAKSHSFLSHFLSGKHDKHDKHDKSSSAVSGSAAMQKSKSSSSVMHHGSRLMAKKIFRSRSKSQTRPAQAPCSWTPQGSCVWNSVTGRQVVLSESSLLHLTEIERKVLQKVAIAKLQALNLGVAVKIPPENVTGAVTKPKRRPYLLKRKALTTGIFDTSRKDNDKDKDGNTPTSGLVFGIPLTQCVEYDRLNRAALGCSPFRSRAELLGGSGDDHRDSMGARRGSRASFSSLIDSPRNDEKGSCESLMLQSRIVGSVPGLLDTISCSSAADIRGSAMEEESSVPNILTECFRHLEQHGLHTLGIFRVSTSKKRIRQLREDFDCGKETSLEEDQCPHDVATLLKEYLRDLPDPLLCRDLYQAFVQTQKLRNRRLQFEALQHLVQLLPPANRDTLYALLNFLSMVAKYSEDCKDALGEPVPGNKMDSNNLATVFAPNILHCIKPGAKDGDRPEDRIDIITVVRTLIDHYKMIFSIPAELLDEVYVHMMDTHPEVLDQLLNKRDAGNAADESVEELDSESNSAPWTPVSLTSEVTLDGHADGKSTPEHKKTYSREECLHETAATGGPNVGMRIRHKDRIRERSTRRKREKNEDGSRTSSTLTIISRLRGQKDEDYQYSKNRSSSLESNSSTHTDDLNRNIRGGDELHILDNNGVIKASLTIPVHAQNQSLAYNIDEDIPYIEDGENGRQHVTVGVIRSPTAPPRRRNHSICSDSSVTSNVQPITGSISVIPGYDSAMGSSVTYSSPIQNTPNSASSSTADPGMYSSPPSWASSPPTSPDSTHTSVNYIPDEVQSPKALVRATRCMNIAKEAAPSLQKVSFSSAQELQQVKDGSKSYQRETSTTKQRTNSSSETSRSTVEVTKTVEREPRFTPSISNIGNDVLRSKTADFERIIKVDTSKPKSPVLSSSDREKKKYTKRRYTDSRHQTRHIPDAETLDSASAQCKIDDKGNSSQSGPVYKRRELISSAPSK